MQINPHAIAPLAQDFVTLWRSPDPQTVYGYTPGICRLESGRLLAVWEEGGPGTPHGYPNTHVAVSDDHGSTWRETGRFRMQHPRPFEAGGIPYVCGHCDPEADGCGALVISSGDADAENWQPPALIAPGEWHQCASAPLYSGGHVYLATERRITHSITTWYPGELSPILMRAKTESNLSKASSWSFSEPLSFRDAVARAEESTSLDDFGVPFWPCPYPAGTFVSPGRDCAPAGWLEGNVVQMPPGHIWHDASGHTFHIFLRAHTGGTGYAAILAIHENAGGTMTPRFVKVPSGKRALFLPCPVGHMRFHVIRDEASGLFWLLGSQPTDSMCPPDQLPPERYNLPNNERSRLVLYFSRNMVDWCFAGLVAKGGAPLETRHYASMTIDGEDLAILSRSGDSMAASPHNGNLITFHRIPGFRSLVY